LSFVIVFRQPFAFLWCFAVLQAFLLCGVGVRTPGLISLTGYAWQVAGTAINLCFDVLGLPVVKLKVEAACVSLPSVETTKLSNEYIPT
jgi:hypothetical protein